MSAEEFSTLLARIAGRLEGRPLDDGMAEFLNAEYPADGPDFARLAELCAEGERDGWLVNREAGGIRFGRAIRPGGRTGTFSVDVVRMKDIRGPHHTHPNGEIGAVIPIAGAPLFDEFQPGWYVYPPGSAHHPTVRGGEAYVIYLLPEGAIEFTGT